MHPDLELDKIRVKILMLATNKKGFNNLQLAEITRYVLSSKFFWKYFNLLKTTVDPVKVFEFLKHLAFSMATPKQQLN